MAAAADRNAESSKASRRDLAELSALADGTLDPTRRAAVEARLAGSAELSELYERERRAADLVRLSVAEVHAPAALRLRIDAEIERRRRVPRRRAYGGLAAAGLAGVVLLLLLVLPAGAPGAPSFSQAAALALRGPALPPPDADPNDPGRQLGRRVGEVYFPNWASTLGWRAVGQRVDHLNGRLAITVYYGWRGRQIAYTVLAAPALREPSGVVSRVAGTELRTLRLGGRLVVTWRRADHTCVLSGAGVPSGELQKLAAWTPAGT